MNFQSKLCSSNKPLVFIGNQIFYQEKDVETYKAQMTKKKELNKEQSNYDLVEIEMNILNKNKTGWRLIYQ